MIVFDEIRIPLIRFAAIETVEAIKPSLQRPIRAVRTRGDILLSDVVIFA